MTPQGNEARATFTAPLTDKEALAIEYVARFLANLQEATPWPDLGIGTRTMWLYRARNIVDIVNRTMGDGQ